MYQCWYLAIEINYCDIFKEFTNNGNDLVAKRIGDIFKCKASLIAWISHATNWCFKCTAVRVRSSSSCILLNHVSSLITRWLWWSAGLSNARSAVLSSPIIKVLELWKCVDYLRNYTRIYGCYLTQCVYKRYIDSWILSSI